MKFLESILIIAALALPQASFSQGRKEDPLVEQYRSSRDHFIIGEGRPTSDKAELRYWVENMIWHHRFTTPELASALSISSEEASALQDRLGISSSNIPPILRQAKIRVLPYPGGRHPRIGFLDGALRPQRETKASIFTPWGNGSEYVVVDVPEAIWSNLGLTYLAHTHVETIWSKTGTTLPKLEWSRPEDGSLFLERTLPNKITYTTHIRAVDDHVELDLTLRNGTDHLLTDLRVQNCVMLKGAPEFTALSNENKVFEAPFAAVHSATHSNRWIITAWEPCHRPWGNPKCPCLHSDPKFPDCPPGESRAVKGWVSFYEGNDVQSEFNRIKVDYFER